MANWNSSKGGVQYYDGQREALAGIFGENGAYDQFMSGKPNAGFERAQTTALDQLRNQQAASGTLNTPLGTRQQSDFLQKSTQAAGDNWLQSLFTFMQPAGQKNKSSGGGVL